MDVTPRVIQWPQPYQNQLAITINNNQQTGRASTNLPQAPQIAIPATGTATGFQFSFNQVVVPVGQSNVISAYRVYRNTQNLFISANLVHTFINNPSQKGPITFTDTITQSTGAQYFYWVTSVDSYGQESLPNSAQSAAAIGSIGSTPFSISGIMTYTSTTSSITWSWTWLVINLADGTTTSVPNNSQAITGLSANTTYFFYPYWDEPTQTLEWIAGGTGTPAYAQSAATPALFAQQNYRNRVALSNGGMSAHTPSSGSGSGSGSNGGGGGGHNIF